MFNFPLYVYCDGSLESNLEKGFKVNEIKYESKNLEASIIRKFCCWFFEL